MELFDTSTNYARRLHIIPATHPRKVGTTAEPGVRLDLAVHEYLLPKSAHAKYTLVMTHGTSFNKDFWNLIIDLLLQDLEISASLKRILAIDAVNHGDSAVCNRGRLGSQTFWPDISYDILTTLNHFNVNGNVIGIGHSMGGGTLCHAAMIAPSIFTATIFIEPILFVMKGQDENIAQQTMRRRDTWSSLDQVRVAFNKSPGLADWDPQQRNLYADLGTYDVGNGTRTLKTPKEQEAATYRAAPYSELLDSLASSRGEHHFIFGEDSKVLSAEQRGEVLRRTQRADRLITVQGAGHLIPMTHPKQLSQILGTILVGIWTNQSQTSLNSRL